MLYDPSIHSRQCHGLTCGACAGMTNSLWMKEGGVLLQMLPYGWEIRPGELIRSCISADMPLASHGHYLQVRHLCVLAHRRVHVCKLCPLDCHVHMLLHCSMQNISWSAPGHLLWLSSSKAMLSMNIAFAPA